MFFSEIYLGQDFSVSARLDILAQMFIAGNCPVPCGMFCRIPGIYP